MLAGLDEFREHLGGELTVTLLAGIGSRLDVHEIDETADPRPRCRLAQRGLAVMRLTGMPLRHLATSPTSPRGVASPRCVTRSRGPARHQGARRAGRPFGVGLRFAARQRSELHGPGGSGGAAATCWRDAACTCSRSTASPTGASTGPGVKERRSTNPTGAAPARLELHRQLAAASAAAPATGGPCRDGSISSVRRGVAPLAVEPARRIFERIVEHVLQSAAQLVGLRRRPPATTRAGDRARAQLRAGDHRRDGGIHRDAAAMSGPGRRLAELTGHDRTGAEHELRTTPGRLPTTSVTPRWIRGRLAAVLARYAARASAFTSCSSARGAARAADRAPSLPSVALAAFAEDVYLHQTVEPARGTG